MCFSSEASFAVSIPLLTGGVYCIKKAIDRPEYLPMAIMPLVVGVQQFMEGLVWHGILHSDPALSYNAALIYMFFVWVFWPSWVPYMTSVLEPHPDKKKKQIQWAQAGLAFGLLLYIPHLFHADWLSPMINKNCLAYNTVVLPDFIIPRWITSIFYLGIVAIPPLTSSHLYLRRFGWMLLVFVPITYFFFINAYISVLCFFAAVITIDLVYIVSYNKCNSGMVALTDKRLFSATPLSRKIQ